MTNKVYQIITENIIKLLESGTVPWSKPWRAHRNFKSGHTYRGLNIFILTSASERNGYKSLLWGTYQSLQQAGGQVKKGEKGHQIILWKWLLTKKDPDDDDEKGKRVPILRYFTVFNIDQCDWEEGTRPNETNGQHYTDEKAQAIIDNMPNRPPITHAGTRAYYTPDDDAVTLPAPESFYTPQAYYGTAYHELGHATGHPTRLNREIKNGFGTEKYSKEELIAEMTAAMLAGHAGIVDDLIDNSAAYIQSWLSVLKNDKKMVIHAAANAQKAADYILGTTYDTDDADD